jgi:hypothetical protein
VIVASHRRSGTHLALDLLRANAPEVRPRFMTLERIEPAHPRHIPVVEFARRLRTRRGTVLVKTHALPGRVAWSTPEAAEFAADLLASSPAIYVHRDGRDVLVSLFHYMRSFSPVLEGVSFRDFIRAPTSTGDGAGLNRAAYWQHHVLTWTESKPAATASFEGLLTDLGSSLAEIADRVALQLHPTVRPIHLAARRRGPLGVLRQPRRWLGRPPRSTAIRPHAGASGSWRDAFGADDLAWFDDHAGAAMRRLGHR